MHACCSLELVVEPWRESLWAAVKATLDSAPDCVAKTVVVAQDEVTSVALPCSAIDDVSHCLPVLPRRQSKWAGRMSWCFPTTTSSRRLVALPLLACRSLNRTAPPSSSCPGCTPSACKPALLRLGPLYQLKTTAAPAARRSKPQPWLPTGKHDSPPRAAPAHSTLPLGA